MSETICGDGRDQKQGWAPGCYENYCRSCGESFLGDKRAVTCSDCAYAEPRKIEVSKQEKA